MSGPLETTRPGTSAIKILDSHAHFLDTSRPEGVVWPEKHNSLYRSWFPETLRDAYPPNSFAGCVAIETSRRDCDDQWLLELSESEPLVQGVVLNLRPDCEGFKHRLSRALTSPNFVGIRLRPIVDYDLNDSVVNVSFGLLEQHRKTVEFGAPSAHLRKSMAKLAGAFPDTWWILDHAGHPPESIGRDWRASMEMLARKPNVAIKATLSALESSETSRLWSLLLDLFGHERVMFGSNWPVYKEHHGIEDSINQLPFTTSEEAEHVFWRNAQKIYALSGRR